MKKVSVVVPIYNGEKHIEQTIKTILRSTYCDLELILVDDGSTDDSLLICEKLRKNDPRIFIYSQENGGVASARNFGIQKATGTYICLCDQDDIVRSETYARQVQRLEADQSDFCMCSTGRSIDGKISVFESLDDACYEGEQILEELLYPLLFNGYNVPVKKSGNNRYPHIWNCMFQKKFLERNGIRFRTYVNYEDDLLVKTEALARAKKVSTMAYPGYFWKVNLKSETYAHKYVDNIGDKQQKCYEDMLNCLTEAIHDKNVLELFTQVTFCKQYLEAIHNLTSPAIKKRYRTIKQYYANMIYSRDFKHCIEARKYLKKGQVKPGILLPILAKKMTIPCYVMEILLDFVLLITLHSQTLTKLERKLKRS